MEWLLPHKTCLPPEGPMRVEQILYTRETDINHLYWLAVTSSDYVNFKNREWMLEGIREWDKVGGDNYGEFIKGYIMLRWIKHCVNN